MEDNKSYFGEIGHGIKTLATGMKVTLKEYCKDYWTNKCTEQYPENRKSGEYFSISHTPAFVISFLYSSSENCPRAFSTKTRNISGFMIDISTFPLASLGISPFSYSRY